MDKILTPEQVKLIREKYEPQERVGHYELRTLLLEVLDNYDAQGVQLADAQAGLAEMITESYKDQLLRQSLQKELADAQADVRALAEALKGIDLDCLVCYDRQRLALARSGVQQVLNRLIQT